jgi:hypothetical protein
MSLNELERKYIRPLSRVEKLQLIADITRMLQQEDEHPASYFNSEDSYPVLTPTIAPDDAPYEAAFQLQQLLEKHNKDR